MKVYIGPYKEKREIRIKIHKYDTWSLDHTLALIIEPALRQLKKETHSYFIPDPEDLPEHLVFKTNLIYEESLFPINKETEKFFYKKQLEQYEYIMDEMIYAFSVVNSDEGIYMLDPLEMERVQRGLKFFGKYYLSLWD
jgi:hypothetical protein